MRYIGPLLILTLGMVACDAKFTDLRPADESMMPVDVTLPDYSDDSCDEAPPEPSDAQLLRETDAMGFVGKNSYSASGSAQLLCLADGTLQLRLSSDFSVSNGPGLIIVLSKRETLDGIDTSTDSNLGQVSCPSAQHEQRYAVPIGDCNSPDSDVEWPHIHIFCEPFNVEFGSAFLEQQ